MTTNNEFSNEITKNESDISEIKIQLEENFGDLEPQILLALSSQWRRPDGSLVFGQPKRKLRQKMGISMIDLENLLKDFRKEIKPLGLELFSYSEDGEIWYCIRSKYVVPNELDMEQQAVLGTIIYFVEKESEKDIPNENHSINPNLLQKKLVDGGYYSDYKLSKILQTLESLSYIQRERKSISYGIRTKIEFKPEKRKEIAEQTGLLLM